jgi:hypothetical protein
MPWEEGEAQRKQFSLLIRCSDRTQEKNYHELNKY